MIALANLLFIMLANGYMLRCAITTKSKWAATMWSASILFPAVLALSNPDAPPVWQIVIAMIVLSLFGWLIIYTLVRTFKRA